jgi:hypothetical protein
MTAHWTEPHCPGCDSINIRNLPPDDSYIGNRSVSCNDCGLGFVLIYKELKPDEPST